jgi:hypothetical protein
MAAAKAELGAFYGQYLYVANMIGPLAQMIFGPRSPDHQASRAGAVSSPCRRSVEIKA